MRKALAAFLFGALAVVATLLVFQRTQMAPIAGEIAYHFNTCVFGTDDFPGGDLDNGRLLRRALVPVRVTPRFYDAHFHEVTQATAPGRYGAVVRIDLGPGILTHRFITLYRTPQPVPGDTLSIPITAQLPAGLFGLNPAVVRTQQPEIGSAVQHMLVDYENRISPESVAILLAGLSETSPDAPPAFLHDNAKTSRRTTAISWTSRAATRRIPRNAGRSFFFCTTRMRPAATWTSSVTARWPD
jgi:hypothetical protein